MRAGRSIVVTELSSQFLAAEGFLVLFLELKFRKAILVVAIGVYEQVAVFDDENAEGKHLFSKTIDRCFLILVKVKLVDFVLKLN